MVNTHTEIETVPYVPVRLRGNTYRKLNDIRVFDSVLRQLSNVAIVDMILLEWIKEHQS